MSYQFSQSKLKVLDTIVATIEERIESSDDRYPIIGLNGFDASGKTELSRELQYYLQQQGYKVQLIHLDDFHNHLKLRRTGENENQAYIDHAFNLELLSQLLQKISNQAEVQEQYMLLDLDTDTYSIEKSYHITNDTIVILEGVLLFRDPINPYFDIRIFLEVDHDILLRRNQQRSDRDPEAVRKRFLSKYLAIQKWYYQVFRPQKQADMVIDNNDYTHPKLV